MYSQLTTYYCKIPENKNSKQQQQKVYAYSACIDNAKPEKKSPHPCMCRYLVYVAPPPPYVSSIQSTPKPKSKSCENGVKSGHFCIQINHSTRSSKA